MKQSPYPSDLAGCYLCRIAFGYPLQTHGVQQRDGADSRKRFIILLKSIRCVLGSRIQTVHIGDEILAGFKRLGIEVFSNLRISRKGFFDGQNCPGSTFVSVLENFTASLYARISSLSGIVTANCHHISQLSDLRLDMSV